MKRLLYHAIRALTRHYPFDTPRARILGILPDVPPGFGSIAGKHGLTYAGYPTGHDHVAKSLFWFGDFDPWVVRTMRRLARPGEVVCDVGANLGDTALPLARWVGSAGKVFCFEPVPVNLVRLRQNIEVNGQAHLTVLPVALSDSTGTFEMVVPDQQPGMARMDQGIGAPGAVKVDAIRFDDWIATTSIERISVFKLDVEGHELSVLRGMPDTLAMGRVGAFVFEHHQTLDSTNELSQLLSTHGYRVFRIYKGFCSTRYLPAPGAETGRPTSDYVAVRPGGESERRLLDRSVARVEHRSPRIQRGCVCG